MRPPAVEIIRSACLTSVLLVTVFIDAEYIHPDRYCQGLSILLKFHVLPKKTIMPNNIKISGDLFKTALDFIFQNIII